MNSEYPWVKGERTLEREVEDYVHEALDHQVSDNPVGYEDLATVLEDSIEQQGYPLEQVFDAFMTSEYVVEDESEYGLRGHEVDVPFENVEMPDIPIEEIQLRSTVEGALVELVKSPGTYHSPILEERTTVLGNDDFAEKAWDYSSESATAQEEQEGHEMLKVVVFGADYQPLANARNNSAAFQKFQNKQQEILRYTSGSDTFPLLIGIGPKYVASRSSAFEYTEPSSDSPDYFVRFDEEQVQEVFDHVNKGTTVLQRDEVDSWTSNPAEALNLPLTVAKMQVLY